MEATGVLDADDEVDLFLLHCVFLPRINSSLAQFSKAWNLHPLHTERNWSPTKIWINNMLPLIDLEDTTESFDNYGIDYHGPAATVDDNAIIIPDTMAPVLSEQLLTQFLSVVEDTLMGYNIT